MTVEEEKVWQFGEPDIRSWRQREVMKVWSNISWPQSFVQLYSLKTNNSCWFHIKIAWNFKVTVCTYSSSKAANNNAPLQSTNGSLVLVIENHSVSIFQNCGCQATMKLTMFSIIPLIILNMSMKPPPWEETKCTHIKIIYDTAPFLSLIKLVNFIEQAKRVNKEQYHTIPIMPKGVKAPACGYRGWRTKKKWTLSFLKQI